MIFEILLSTETRDSLFFQPDGDIFSAADVREQLHAYYNGGDETGIYESAAQVDADDLEHVFELTQNLTPSGWLAGDRVVDGTRRGKLQTRSLSVGDVVVKLDDENGEVLNTYVVDRVGFCELS